MNSPPRPTRPLPSPPGPDAWDRGAAWLAEHGALPALALLTLGMCVIYGGVFRGEVAGDDLTFHMAESRRLADCIAAGDWDFWNPSANAGYASAYYYQVIPQLASALPAALFGHHTFWFQLTVFLPLVLGPLAAYRGMRLMGADRWQAVIAAFVLSFTIGASRWGFGADGTFSVGLYTQTWALSAFPLALGHGVRWLRDGKGLAPAIAWGAFVGLCHPFGGVSLGITLALGVTANVMMTRALWRSPLLLGILLVVVGVLGAGLWYVLARSSPELAAFPLALVVGGAARIAFGGLRDATGRAALREVYGPPIRLVILGLTLGLAAMPGWITMLIDAKGFGGFPHRVDDEVGPGFVQLGSWHLKGMILDHGRVTVLTWALPVVLIFARGKLFRWLWLPGLVFALLLGLGPHMPKTADDLIPAVRFLGAMQIMFGLAIGAGAYSIGKTLWNSPEDGLIARSLRAAISLGGKRARLWILDQPLQYGIRTGIAAVAAALAVLIAVPGSRVEADRVHALKDYPTSPRDQMMTIVDALEKAPPGRKQVGPGCENHWWNLLSYVYGRVPSLLQMGGGGLQASPNYDFLWTVRDFPKLAWVYDTPYLEFEKVKGNTMPVGDVVVETEGYVVRKLPAPGLVSPIQLTGVLPDGPTGARSKAREAAIAWLRTDLPMKNRHLLYAGYGLPGPAPTGQVLRSWRQDSPGDLADIVAEVQVNGVTTFVARESWHPRWHAYLDGVEIPIRRVTPDFPAVDVPTGKHVIQFRFERPWWAHASWLAWPGVTLLAWFALWWWTRRRDRTAALASP